MFYTEHWWTVCIAAKMSCKVLSSVVVTRPSSGLLTDVHQQGGHGLQITPGALWLCMAECHFSQSQSKSGDNCDRGLCKSNPWGFVRSRGSHKLNNKCKKYYSALCNYWHSEAFFLGGSNYLKKLDAQISYHLKNTNLPCYCNWERFACLGDIFVHLTFSLIIHDYL